ncbi:MAG TPA: M3 family metallopeptidase [Burkholderiaceae bacterium]|nr:M3 family metallopeptidase [Burkholderiaceae bacterium]
MNKHALRRFLAAAAFGAGLLAPAAAAERPPVPILDAAAIEARCPQELENARRQKARMERASGAGAILAEWNRLSASVQDFVYPVYLLANVAVDQATRDAARKCVEAFTPFDTELFQSDRLYARVRALKPRDAIDALYRQDLLEAFEDAGVALAADKRARVKAIREELDKLSLQFQSNINEDRTTVAVSEEEARGLPPAWIAARQRDAEGRLIVTLDYPTYVPFLENAVDEDARRRVWIAKQREGGERNLELLDRALALRHELARIYGYPDYATFSLRRTMARSPAAVEDFLAKVKAAVDEGEARDLQELRADKAALLGVPLERVQLHRWDVPFHSERVRRARFAIDQEALRAYFPTETSVAYALKLAAVLYGVAFVARDVPRWADDVRYYDVYERTAAGRPGAFVGGIYLDLFPRPGKYNHAAAFTVRSVSTLAKRTPVSALVANLDRRGLTHDELETLLHEFGHVLHGVLSKTRYVDHGGTSVKRDFVEAPSQMFEEWARREQPLALFAQLCPQCPPLTPATVERLREARRFGIGMRYARQWQFATFDMRLHRGAPQPALAVWAEIERASRLGHVEGTLFPAGFGHLMGGYAAGYYGYMWSEVLALDMLAGFKGNLLDPAAGRRYRQAILAMGGQRPPHALVEAFLGRPPAHDAFYAEITGKRQ